MSSPGRETAAIAVADLAVRRDGALIVDNITLSVGEGEWVTVIGPNGAGKSTALRAVAGLLPFTGSVRLYGSPVDRLHRRDRAKAIAVVMQNPVVPPAMTVFDYVLLGRTPYIPALGRESAADLAAVDEELAALDLVPFAGRRLDTLSGGERQRVFLARALAQGARILLLDEPTSALDIGHQQEVLELVDRLRAERALTVLATMHDLSTAGEYADRMVMLAGGRVVAAGTPTEVLTESNLAEHYRVRVRVIAGDHGPLVVAVRS
ncbi:ABC transporter [Actinoplanes sp. SE50]|uniref:ABC transporter ATP-binding protein n=1 Tax=unclassified Actinoplanes TaxID=2626549 RepID=UPI00023EC1C5|nr:MULTISPECIES: ABC transporter ATP-binding protein [unclassified Actinoplanes]AEV81323.1 iron complex transport system ATP-binding protein [Actinoplanes sp. SE50/110]ATO79726.1 ABC transporter [Actinoplanes sp. SE50]SLL97129.1 ABC transporter [Actinoplanes sp. SE50/110]